MLPVEIRKTLGINKDDKLDLFLFTSEGRIVIKRGDNDVR